MFYRASNIVHFKVNLIRDLILKRMRLMTTRLQITREMIQIWILIILDKEIIKSQTEYWLKKISLTEKIYFKWKIQDFKTNNLNKI